MRDGFLLGIIEGFYGKSWSWQARLSTPAWLAGHGLNTYLYAPKSDVFLRQQWRESWPLVQRDELARLSATCRQAGVLFGVGLSPIGTRDFLSNREDRAHLQSRLQEINALQADVLAILFDDIPGSGVDAAQQVALVRMVLDTSTARRVLVCPSYYSHDPRLSEVFGPMPESYLADLGQGLDPAVELFWTGSRVCSTSYTVEEFRELAAVLQRPPVLWDNYPVNDGKAISPFLHLRAFSDRPAALQDVLHGHLANPMNQPMLSRIPLATLAGLYGDSGVATDAAILAVCGDARLAARLLSDVPLFQDTGLEVMAEPTRQSLQAVYGQWRGHPVADEVLAWLAGEYRFDPACLTG